MSSARQKRKSWFTPGRSGLRASLVCSSHNTLSPPSPPTNMPALRLDNPKDTTDDREIMILSHFAKPPHVDFGKLRVGKSASRSLVIRNPHDYPQDVTVEKFPFKKNFNIDFTNFTVEEECEVEVRLEWRPEDEMCCREMVLLRINGVYRLQAYLLGRCEEPPKPKKKKSFFKGKSTITSTMKGQDPFFRGRAGAPLAREKPIIQKTLAPPTVTKQPLSPVSPNVPPPMLKRERTYETDKESRSPLIEKFFQKPKNSPLKKNLEEHHNIQKENLIMDKENCHDYSPVDIRRETVLAKRNPSSPTRRSPLPFSSVDDIRRETVLVKKSLDLDSLPSMQIDSLEVDLRRETVVITGKKDRLNELTGNEENSKSSLPDPRRETVVINSLTPQGEELDDVDFRRETVVVRPMKRQNTGPLLDSLDIQRLESGDDLAKNRLPSPFQQASGETRRLVEDPVSPLEFTFRPVLGNSGDYSSTPTGSLMPSTMYFSAVSTQPAPSLNRTAQEGPDSLSRTPGSMRRTRTYTRILDNKTPIRSDVFDLSESCGRRDSNGSSNLSEQFDDSLMVDKTVVTPNSFLKEHRESMGLNAMPVTPNSFLKETRESATMPAKNVFSPDAVLKASVPHNVVLDQLKSVRESLTKRRSFENEHASFGKAFGTPTVSLSRASLTTPSPGQTRPEVTPQVNSATVTKSKADVHECDEATKASREGRILLGTRLVNDDDDDDDSSRVLKQSSSVTELERKRGKCLFDDEDDKENLVASPFLTSERIKRRSIFRCQRRQSSLRSFSSLDTDGPLSLTTSSYSEGSSETIATTSCGDSSLATSEVGMATGREVEGQAVGVEDGSEESNSRDDGCLVPGDDEVVMATELVDKEIVERLRTAAVAMKTETVAKKTETVAMKTETVAMKTETVAMKTETDREDATEHRTARVKRPIAAGRRLFEPTNKSRSHSVDGRANSQSALKEKSRGRHESERKRRSGETSLPDQKRAKPDKRLTRTEKLRIAASTKIKQSPTREKHRKPSGSRPPVAQARLVLLKNNNNDNTTAMPKHPMPFASKNLYYDEKWVEKEERGFTRWLNFVLTPQDDEQETSTHIQEAVSLCLSPRKGTHVERLAPSREQVSMRIYTARRKLNQLRRQSCRLFQSQEVIQVVRKLEMEIDCGRLLVRTDRVLHADLGMSRRIVDVIMMYNPLWLRIGLETTYGEILPVHGSGDVQGLSRFLLTRLLHNPDLAKQYAHPTVPHSYKQGYDVALSAFTLKRLLVLVYFLDKAKQHRLLSHDPCLFGKDAEFKSSRDLLVDFNKSYLRGEGDLCKHLSYLGYHVTHVQTALDEYDYAVTSLANALRDGVRLVRVVEMLTNEWTMRKKLRVPAISRLQKIHNVEVAFTALVQYGIQLHTLEGTPITSRDIVDGHREKTLAILWRIIFKFQIEILIDEKQLEDEIRFLRRLLRHRSNMAAVRTSSSSLSSLGSVGESEMETGDYYHSHKLLLLHKWCQTICSFYDVRVDNFTTAFSDGRVLCYIVHHYHPSLLPRSLIRDVTTLTVSSANQSDDLDTSSADDSLDAVFGGTFSPATGRPTMYYRLLDNEKDNFKILLQSVVDLGGVPVMIRANDMSNTIPDEKLVITFTLYLCARLLDIRAETRAARIIQSAWRTYRLRNVHRDLRLASQSALTIQSAVRDWLRRRRDVRRHVSATTIQSAWRVYVARRHVTSLRKEREREEHERAVLLLQKSLRALQAKRLMQRHQAAKRLQTAWRRHSQRQRYVRLRQSAILIQSVVRMRIERRKFVRMREAVVALQRSWRATLLSRRERTYYETLRHSTVFLQQRWRFSVRLSNLRRHKAATTIATAYRAFVQRREYARLHYGCVVLQAQYRMRKVRSEYVRIRNAALLVQSYYRAYQLGKSLRQQLERRHLAARTIQSTWRRFVERQRYSRLRMATILVQKSVKGRKERRRFLELKEATVALQRRYRARAVASRIEREFLEKTTAVTRMQSVVRGRIARKRFLEMKEAARKIQALVRARRTRNEYLRKRAAVLTIQRRYRATMVARSEMMGFEIVKANAVIIQNSVRGWLVRREFHRQRSACVRIQAFTRMVLAKKHFNEMKVSTLMIQSWYRGLIETRLAVAERRQKIENIVKIQALFRGRKVRSELARRIEAVRRIQSRFRAHMTRVEYLKRRQSVLTIQRAFRRSRESTAAREEFLTLRNGVVRLQALVRGRNAVREYRDTRFKIVRLQALVRRNQARTRFLKLQMAALVVQRHFRSLTVARDQKREYENLRRSVVQLQALQRGRLARIRFQKLRTSAIRVQSNVRRYLAMRRYRQVRGATLTIQRYYRSYRLSQDCQREYSTKRQAAVRIQSIYRGHLVRKRARAVVSSVERIQTWYRMKRERRRYAKLRASAVVIQRRFRATLRMREDCLMYHVKRGAALTIQSRMRTVLARREFLRMRSAACRIQAFWRGRKCREEFSELKRATRVIQRQYRSYRLASKVRHEFVNKIERIVKLQACIRGWTQRRRYLTVRNAIVQCQALVRARQTLQRFVTLRRSVIVVQRRYRARQLMTSQRRVYENRRRQIVLVQKCVRAFLARRRSLRNSSAKTIQTTWRRYKERNSFLEKKASAIRIQSAFRQWKERRNYSKIRQAVSTIQRSCRAYRLGEKERYHLLREQCAAMAIQTWYKTYKIRSQYLERRAKVVRLQAIVRRNSARKRYLEVREATIRIQCWYRSVRIARTKRDQYLNSRLSIIKIQSLWRGHYVRKRLRMTLSAILIQSWFRMHTQRRNYRRTIDWITKLQARIRGRITRQNLVRRTRAVSTISRWYRRIASERKEEKERELRRVAATRIQSRFRAIWQRRSYLAIRRHLVLLQAVCRGSLARRRTSELREELERERENVKRANDAATLIQTCYRQYKEREIREEEERRRFLYLGSFVRAARYHYCAIQIQRCFRNHRALQQARRHVRSVHLIQHWMRGRLQRLRYLRLRQSALVLQKLTRDWLRRRHVAASVIQSAARVWLERRRMLRRAAAALKIQTIWRACRVRRSYKSKKIAEVRRRLQFANAAATVEKRLANRTTLALEYLLQYRQLSAILEALMHLDAATRLSWRCCERMVEAGAVEVLFTLMRSCNRSVPHMEIIKLALSVLLNLARYDQTVSAIYRVPDCVPSLVELLSMYLGKGLIFTRTCTLLGVMGTHDKTSCRLDDKLTSKLRSVHSVTFRKHKLSEQYKQNVARKSALKSGLVVSQTPSKRPKQKPFWLLTGKGQNQETEDPLEAIEFVMTSFRLGFIKK